MLLFRSVCFKPLQQLQTLLFWLTVDHRWSGFLEPVQHLYIFFDRYSDFTFCFRHSFHHIYLKNPYNIFCLCLNSVFLIVFDFDSSENPCFGCLDDVSAYRWSEIFSYNSPPIHEYFSRYKIAFPRGGRRGRVFRIPTPSRGGCKLISTHTLSDTTS